MHQYYVPSIHEIMTCICKDLVPGLFYYAPNYWFNVQGSIPLHRLLHVLCVTTQNARQMGVRQ